MPTKPAIAVAAIVAAVASTACTQRVADFTLLSTKNVDLSRAETFQRAPQRTEGKSEEALILFIPTGEPSVKEAVDEAIEAAPGAVALTDGVIHSHVFLIPLLGGTVGYTVEGTPLIDPKMRNEVTGTEASRPAVGQKDELQSPSVW